MRLGRVGLNARRLCGSAREGRASPRRPVRSLPLRRYFGTDDGTGQYYESIDLIDAFHPQTILAHGLTTSRFRSATVPCCGCGSSCS